MSQTLIDDFPEHYRDSPEMRSLQNAYDKAVSKLENDWEDLLSQLIVGTATWGLALWERALGLETPAASYEVRRSRVLAKLRGAGTATADLLQNVAMSYYQGEITVTEVPQEYKAIVAFVNQIGRPPGVETLMAALEEIIPAHLQLEYLWRYRTWADVGGMTWAELAGKTWLEAKEGEI